MNLLLRIKGLNKAYQVNGRAQAVLSNLEFELHKGSSLSIKGDSGCGKSTLLHLIGGLDKPDTGEIWFDGDPVHKMGELSLSRLRRSKVSYIFQDYQLIPTLSVKDNICFQAVLAQNQAPDFIEDIVRKLDLKDCLSKLPTQLSGGQQQRVAIARAIAHKPQLILADEPTGNLDSRNSNTAIELLLSAVEVAGSALIMVTHSDEMANALERTMILESGRLNDSREVIALVNNV